jgi:uncharacterized protein (TIGR01777 family)
MTGGTGLIGRNLCRLLLSVGHDLTVLSRKPYSVPSLSGPKVHAIAGLEEWQPDESYDAVINLAGEPIIDSRWTTKRRQLLWDSRVSLTGELVSFMAAARQKPKVLLSGSAVGYYGDRGQVELDESCQAGEGFGAQLCKEWEEAALGAERLGVRVCVMRTGLVLAREGGMLGRMLPAFRFALGGSWAMARNG